MEEEAAHKVEEEVVHKELEESPHKMAKQVVLSEYHQDMEVKAAK